ncbi:fibroblast growth factor 21 isoform X1 [Misgurnus anguillicaudatus]|uniref:fibroblast growth factor 21 isoform X1 n=1 Tax=Misgurnus anguillicaudatus TaxID=75329 RepID=UPI003CCEFBA5
MPTCTAQSIMFFAALFSFLIVFPHLHLCMYVPAQSVLLLFSSQVREQLLYTENKIRGLFLEISDDGSVKGSSTQNRNCVLEMRSVKAGGTVIRGVASSLFLCVNNEGQLRGQGEYAEEDCIFKELLLENGYSCFLSPHNGLSVSLLSSKQSRLKHCPESSLFLPIIPTQFMIPARENSQIQEVKQYIQDVNLDSDDPLGMAHQSHIQSIFSPSLYT